MHIQVKYGLIRILNQEVDLCEQADKLDLKCPLKKGPMTLTRDVELPKEIPPVSFFFPLFYLFSLAVTVLAC